MNCNRVQNSLSEFLDGALPESEQVALRLHLQNCRECAGQCEDLHDLCFRLRDLPVLRSPRELATRLNVVASHEIARRQGNVDFYSGIRKWWLRARLSTRDLMKPLALPAAGGVLSSIVFFAMLVNACGFVQPPVNDVPLGYYTQGSVDELSPFGYSVHGLEVEVTLDQAGHVIGYIPHGTVSQEDWKQLGKLILFTRFSPATAFGAFTSGGKVLVKSHRINVRG